MNECLLLSAVSTKGKWPPNLRNQQQSRQGFMRECRPTTCCVTWVSWERAVHMTDCCMLSIFFLKSLSGRQSSNVIRVVSGDSIPGGTQLGEHWRHFHKWLNSQPVPLESDAERTSLSSCRNRQCALPHCSAPCPNTGVQPPVYTTVFSCRRNLRSMRPLNVILFSVYVSEPSNLPLQIFLSINLLPMEHENLTDSKILKQKKRMMSLLLWQIKEPYIRKYIYIIKKELLWKSMT